LALGVGGLAPGAIYSSAPKVTPTAEMLPITVGLFQQASNLGQFAGPLVVGLTIERMGVGPSANRHGSPGRPRFGHRFGHSAPTI
jgi:hypothetical protein